MINSINNFNNNYNMYNNTKMNNNMTFKRKPQEIIAEEVLACGRDNEAVIDVVKGAPPKILSAMSKAYKKLIPLSEKAREKMDLTDFVNYGNVAKELVCMIVYPLQVLTNPDLPTDKKRFVGMYDFFVTCFSLGGTLVFAKYGKKAMKKGCTSLMEKFEGDMMKKARGNSVDAKKLDGILKDAIDGGAFVTGIALQTILFKRILAPAFSPPLAAAARKKMEANDAAKAQKNPSDMMIPQQLDAAMNKVDKK